MGKKSFAEKVNSAKLMIAGCSENDARVAKRGIDKEFVSVMASVYNQAVNMNIEQEALKAKLKQKTTELSATMKELGKKYREAKKAVKLEMEQSSWKGFGIDDKK